MAKYLEPRYLIYMVVASVIAVVALQFTGESEVLQADPPLERLEMDMHDHRDRYPIAIMPEASDDETRRR
jgi:hypothetical protein